MILGQKVPYTSVNIGKKVHPILASSQSYADILLFPKIGLRWGYTKFFILNIFTISRLRYWNVQRFSTLSPFFVEVQLS